MKITNVPGTIGAYQNSGARKVAGVKEVARTSKGDGVELSKEAQQVKALRDKVSQAPEVREQRIAELRQQIQAGTYRPDAKEVAAKMLKSRAFDELV